MNKRVMAVFTLVLMTISAHSQAATQPLTQARCNLTASTAPDIRGLRLGMTTESLLALFPGSSKRKEIRDALEKVKASTSEEITYLSFYPATDGSGGKFAGIDSVSVGLYKGRAVDFNILYVGTPWRTIDDWVAKLSETLTLPGAPEWVAGPNESPNKILRCNGIEIEAAIQGGGSSIRIRNAEALKGMAERGNAGEEKKRREFKP